MPAPTLLPSKGRGQGFSLNLSECVVGRSWCTWTCVSVVEVPLFSQDRRQSMAENLSSSVSFYALQTLNRSIEGAFHVHEPFLYQGYTYQQPVATDLLNAELVQDLEGADPLGQFQVYGLPVFGFWFFVPQKSEYLFIYWLAAQTPYPVLLTLHVGHVGLTPEERYQLLDKTPATLEYYKAQNFIILPYQPVNLTPAVIRFKVNEHGRNT